MTNHVQERVHLIQSFFEPHFFQAYLEANDWIKEIQFFGSFMKGTNHDESDIDIIIVPMKAYLEVTEDQTELIDTLYGLLEDFTENLCYDIPLDIKLQEFQNKNEQYGLSLPTDGLVVFYSFIKGEVGAVASLSRQKGWTFSSH